MWLMTENSTVQRTALLIRCTSEEAELIREAAKAERRTISGYVLHSILQRIAVRNKTQKQFRERLDQPPTKPAVTKAKAHSSGT